MKRLTEEFLLQEFWRFYEENTRYPERKEMKANKGYPSSDAYAARWGSWTQFLKHLDLLGENSWYKYDEAVLSSLYENAPKQEIMNKLMVKRTWESIGMKANSMGLKRNQTVMHQIYSDEHLIELLIKYKNIHNKAPKGSDYKTDELPCRKAYALRFGSWNNALKLADLQLNSRKDISNEELIQSALNFYSTHGKSPKYNELPFSHATVKQRWGSWNMFLNDIGLPLNVDFCNLNEEEAKMFLVDLKSKIGRTPISSDLNDIEGVNRAWFAKKFGSWNNALVASGILSEEEVVSTQIAVGNSIRFLIQLSNDLGRIPSVKEYDQYSKTQSQRILERRSLSEQLDKSFLQLCDEYLNYSSLDLSNGYGRVSVNIEGKRCKSLDEMNISNLFLENNLDIVYEPSYNEVIKTENCRYKFDWSIEINSKIFYIEYFGLYYPNDKSKMIQEYVAKAHHKTKLCKLNDISLIDIYPSDLDNNFSALIKKFKNKGMLIKSKN